MQELPREKTRGKRIRLQGYGINMFAVIDQIHDFAVKLLRHQTILFSVHKALKHRADIFNLTFVNAGIDADEESALGDDVSVG